MPVRPRLAVVGVVAMSLTAIAADPMPADPKLPTVWIIGDSTAHQTGKSPLLIGWADIVDRHFDTTKANIVNRARGGRSSRTFITEGLWDDVLKNVKAGDVLLMQFGHNDSSPVDDADRSRGSLHGTGEETQDIFNQVRKVNETVHTYGWYLKKIIADAKAKGMSVIVFSPVPRCPKGEQVTPSTEATGYQEWARDAATASGVPYVDVHSVIWKTYGKLTGEQIKATYFTPEDGTHTNAAGAELNAVSVVEGLKALPGDPVAGFLK